MRKLLFVFILLSTLFSCSDEDKVLTQFSSKEIRITTSDGSRGVYEKGNISIGVTVKSFVYNRETKEQIYRAYDTYCPVKDHQGERTIHLWIESSPAVFFCNDRSCKAEFDGKTGNPINENAQGHRLKVYRMDYDRETDTYTVWK